MKLLVPGKLPPTVVIHGISDRNVVFSTAEEFIDKTKKMGNNIVFEPPGGAGHFFGGG